LNPGWENYHSGVRRLLPGNAWGSEKCEVRQERAGDRRLEISFWGEMISQRRGPVEKEWGGAAPKGLTLNLRKEKGHVTSSAFIEQKDSCIDNGRRKRGQKIIALNDSGVELGEPS